jgi:antitoxin ParD1/3/4
MNIEFTLKDELADYIKGKVAAGHYASSSEVVTEALQLMMKDEQLKIAKLKKLRLAWQQGIESGAVGDIDFEALKQGRT